MGLTGWPTGHTPGSCVFTRKAQAILLRLVPLSRIPDLKSSYRGSDIGTHLPSPGILGLGAQLYLSFSLFIPGLSCELPQKCGVSLDPAHVGAWAGATACLRVILYPLVRLPLQ